MFRTVSNVLILCIFTLCLWALPYQPAYAKLDIITVQAEGTGANDKEAVLDALQWAVSQVNGVEIAASVQSQFSEVTAEIDGGVSNLLTSDFSKNIQTTTKGLIESFRIIDTTFDGGVHVARIEANIAKYKQSKQLKRLRLAVSDIYIDSNVNDRSEADIITRTLRRSVTDYLTQTRKFAMIDRTFIEATQKELNFILGGNSPTVELVRLGNKVGTDYIIVMTVNQLDMATRETIYSTANVTKKTRSHDIDISVRIIDVATSQIKFSYSITKSDKSSYRQLAKSSGQLLGQIISNAIYPARIVDIEGGMVTINQGGKTLRKGEIYDLVKLGKALVDPYTKEKIGRKEIAVGQVKIKAVQAKQSSAEIISFDGVNKNILTATDYIIRPILNQISEDEVAAQKMQDAKAKIQQQKDSFFD